jgi:hypothetical protein
MITADKPLTRAEIKALRELVKSWEPVVKAGIKAANSEPNF